MLKLNYTELGLFIEQVDVALDVWIAQWVQLSVRTGQSVHIEPSHASFLVPGKAKSLATLKALPEVVADSSIQTASVDYDTVEISFQGLWIAQQVEAEEGMFVVTLSDRAETLIRCLWQTAPYRASHLI